MNTITIIRNDFNELLVGLHNLFFYWRHSIKLRLAIVLADMKQKAYNKRYFVVLLDIPGKEKLVSINNNEFDNLKRKKWLPKNMSFLELEEKSFYQTALTLNNTTTREQRKSAKEKYLKYAKKHLR